MESVTVTVQRNESLPPVDLADFEPVSPNYELWAPTPGFKDDYLFTPDSSDDDDEHESDEEPSSDEEVAVPLSPLFSNVDDEEEDSEVQYEDILVGLGSKKRTLKQSQETDCIYISSSEEEDENLEPPTKVKKLGDEDIFSNYALDTKFFHNLRNPHTNSIILNEILYNDDFTVKVDIKVEMQDFFRYFEELVNYLCTSVERALSFEQAQKEIIHYLHTETCEEYEDIVTTLEEDPTHLCVPEPMSGEDWRSAFCDNCLLDENCPAGNYHVDSPTTTIMIHQILFGSEQFSLYKLWDTLSGARIDDPFMTFVFENHQDYDNYPDYCARVGKLMDKLRVLKLVDFGEFGIPIPSVLFRQDDGDGLVSCCRNLKEYGFAVSRVAKKLNTKEYPESVPRMLAASMQLHYIQSKTSMIEMEV